MKEFTRTHNLLSGLGAIHKFYMQKIDSLPISEQIGLILYDYFIREKSTKFNFLENLPGDYFKDLAFKFDEVYSAGISNLMYKDGTENVNTIYSVLFGIMMEINDIFNEENYEEVDD